MRTSGTFWNFFFKPMLALTVLGGAATAQTPRLVDGDLTARSLPEQKPGERWVWSGDFAGGLYGRIVLVNAETGEYLAAVDTGWEGIKLDIPKTGDVFYNHGFFMSRGFRGPRVDAIEIFDKKSLQKRARSWCRRR